MRRAIKVIVAAAAITATATTIQQDAKAALPPQAITDKDLQQLNSDNPHTFTDLQQFKSDGPIAFTDIQQLMPGGSVPLASLSGYSPRPMALINSPLTSYFDLSQVVLFGSANTDYFSIVPPPPVSFEQPAQRESSARESDLDMAPERPAALEPSRDTDLPSARQLRSPILRIQFSVPALAPMAHTFFCLKYPDDCQVHKIVVRGDAVALTAQRWAELVRVNAAVNRAIIPRPNTKGLAAEKWLISPKAGECHDYAVTKRHELLALGWPEQDLLLSEVVTSWGEHHLVLVIRTSDGDFVADNLNPDIRSWSKTPYQWVRIQSPDNPLLWSRIASTTARTRVSELAN